ncbi:peptidoglycan-binding domain-containing protein [Streptomyces sp. NPDC002588]|uniref:peptidoglycan-binding domain-containing protein n=1 Tax=Streptomyces sp. NPDC002588 TaxID=3154419 RepID=UPI0033319EFE
MRKHRTAAGLATIAVLAVAGATAAAGQAAAAPTADAVPISVQVSDTSCDYTTATPTLPYGSTGSAVKQVQCLLIQCGYYAGPVDGVFGPGLLTALRRFQADHGLIPNGIVDAATWAALREC